MEDRELPLLAASTRLNFITVHVAEMRDLVRRGMNSPAALIRPAWGVRLAVVSKSLLAKELRYGA
jgi:hypothetical protein